MFLPSSFLVLLIFFLPDASSSQSNSDDGPAVSDDPPNLPVGCANMDDIHRGNAIYVDKTEFALKLIKDPGKSFSLQRPRKFGKTFFLNTLHDILAGEKDKFKDYNISRSKYSWEEHTVVMLDLEDGMTVESFSLVLRRYARMHGVDKLLIDIRLNSSDYFRELLFALKQKGKPVAVLIDGYDRPFKGLLPETREYFYRIFGLLKGLSSRGIINFVFLAGCGRIDLLGTTLGTRDISLLPEYASVCGFTLDEIRTYFGAHVQKKAHRYNVSQDTIYERITAQYNGYRFTEALTSVYNPTSILYYLAEGWLKPSNYWIRTRTHSDSVIEELIKARVKSRNILLDLEKCYRKEELFEDTEGAVSKDGGSFTKPVATKSTQLSLESVLFQSGYLTIVSCDEVRETYSLKFPNDEVEEVFTKAITLAMQQDEAAVSLHNEAVFSLRDLKIDRLLHIFNEYMRTRCFILTKVHCTVKEKLFHIALKSLLTIHSGLSVFEGKHTNKNGTDRERYDIYVETFKYRFLFTLEYAGEDAQIGSRESRKYEFAISEPRDGKTPVYVLITLKNDGVVQWQGALYDTVSNRTIFLSKFGPEASTMYPRLAVSNQCNVCRPPKNFSSRAALSRHIKNIHNNTEFKCDHAGCDMNFDRKRSLSLHKRVHSTQLPGTDRTDSPSSTVDS